MKAFTINNSACDCAGSICFYFFFSVCNVGVAHVVITHVLVDAIFNARSSSSNGILCGVGAIITRVFTQVDY